MALCARLPVAILTFAMVIGCVRLGYETVQRGLCFVCLCHFWWMALQSD